MMMEPKSKINLPNSNYLVNVKEFDFNVEPVSKLCVSIIHRLQELGASVATNSEKYPTSIFISYYKNFIPQKKLDYTVVGSKIELTLSLLDNDNLQYEERLKNFLDCLYKINKGVFNEQPSSVEWVQVINKYKL